MTHAPRLVVGIVLGVALAMPGAAFAELQCAGGIISLGDSQVDLLAKCGPPSLRESRVDERWAVSDVAGAGRRASIVIEEWSYDFGPNSFTYLVRLENGRVVAVERGTYGHRQGPPPERERPPRATCDENSIHEGDMKLDVLSRCGPPVVLDAWDEAFDEAVSYAEGGAAGRTFTRHVERWTYDFGRNRFIRFVKFVNGRVVKVNTGSYGYAD